MASCKSRCLVSLMFRCMSDKSVAIPRSGGESIRNVTLPRPDFVQPAPNVAGIYFEKCTSDVFLLFCKSKDDRFYNRFFLS
jgi:hypothetical protein